MPLLENGVRFCGVGEFEDLVNKDAHVARLEQAGDDREGGSVGSDLVARRAQAEGRRVVDEGGPASGGRVDDEAAGADDGERPSSRVVVNIADEVDDDVDVRDDIFEPRRRVVDCFVRELVF